jgi:amidase
VLCPHRILYWVRKVVTGVLFVAGAVITGKSTCEDLCYSAGCITSISGPCLNPHDVTRSVAGSSSGSAALVR